MGSKSYELRKLVQQSQDSIEINDFAQAIICYEKIFELTKDYHFKQKIANIHYKIYRNIVKAEEMFSCPGYKIVEDRKIRCHKVGGHGPETFVEGVQNSCNPVFMDIGLSLGVERFCDYFQQLCNICIILHNKFIYF